MKKKQLVFIGPKAQKTVTRMARVLKYRGGYETVLVCFSKVNEEFVKNTYDKIIYLELDFSPSPKNISRLLKKLTGKEARTFFKKIDALNPYITQIHGPSIISLLFFLLMKKKPKIFWLGDIWHHSEKKISFRKGTGRMQYVNYLIEKFIFKRADGIINKSGEGSLDVLKSKIKGPVLDFLPYCLDEWIVPPKKKKIDKKKEIHIAYAGMSWDKWDGHAPFEEMVRKIIEQGIHLHFYPSTIKKETKSMLENLSKKNKFLHFYSRQDRDKIKKIISRYDYGIHLDFCDSSVNSKWLEVAISSKVFVYIEAGLPIFLNKQFKNLTNIVERNKMGLGITYKDLGKLREIISKYKPPSVEDIKNAQKNLKMSKQIHRVEEFYDKIHALSKG
ncbi:MAG: hypothetical protein KKF39_05550 [Nanoarchaeota archaeon]|nr:hypothetical protein [Nanoarchaeota archaeon]